MKEKRRASFMESTSGNSVVKRVVRSQKSKRLEKKSLYIGCLITLCDNLHTFLELHCVSVVSVRVRCSVRLSL